MIRPIAILMILFSTTPCNSAEFVVTVPDELIRDGARWYGYDSHKHSQSRSQYVLEKILKENGAAVDFCIRALTWGRCKGLQDAGITIEAKD